METASVSLLCLPCAGASATMYLRWRRRLPAWVRVVPVELPGRGARLGEPLVRCFDALVAQLCAEQAGVMQGRYALFGHSMGALLAWGIARRLHAQGRPLPLALLPSGSAAPAQRDAARLAGLRGDAALVAELRRQGGTPDEVFDNPELLRLTLDVLAADYRVCAGFRHTTQAPLPMPVHAFAGHDDDIALAQVQAWRAETAGAFTLDELPGGHFFLRQHEAAFLDALTTRLREALVPGARDAAHALA